MIYNAGTELGFSYPDIVELPNCTIDTGVPIQHRDDFTAVHLGLTRKPQETARMQVVSSEDRLHLSILESEVPFMCFYGATIQKSLPFLAEPISQLEVRRENESNQLIFWIPREIVVGGLELCLSAFFKRIALETKKKHSMSLQ